MMNRDLRIVKNTASVLFISNMTFDRIYHISPIVI